MVDNKDLKLRVAEIFEDIVFFINCNNFRDYNKFSKCYIEVGELVRYIDSKRKEIEGDL